jgi:hypothetical protein
VKRSELQVGMEYAIGARSSFSTAKRATLIGFEEPIVVPDGWQGHDEREARGTVFELHESETPWGHAPSPMKSGKRDSRRVLVPHGGNILRTWPQEEERRRAEEQRTAAYRAEQETVRELTRANLKALRERFGFDVAARDQTGDGDVQIGYGRGEVVLSARGLAELIELISGPVLAPGAVPLALPGPASRSLAFVEQAAKVDLGGFEEHELERLKAIAGEAANRAADWRAVFERALWAKQHPGEAF